MTATDYAQIEAARHKRARKLKSWVSAHPLSTWHDSTTIMMRRKMDGSIALIPVGGKELRTRTSGEQLPIPLPSDPYPDPV